MKVSFRPVPPLLFLPGGVRAYIRPFQKKGGKGGFNRNKNGGPKRDRDAHRPGVRGSYDTIVSENALYEKYYKEAKVVPEEEWDDFWSALKRTLPTTFRFTGSRGFVTVSRVTVAVKADSRVIDMP